MTITITQTGPGTSTAGVGVDFAPKSVIEALPALYSTEDTPVADKQVIAKWFAPYGSGKWFACEIDAATGECFGFIQNQHGGELGYFSLQELADSRVDLGACIVPGIERDVHFTPKTLGEIVASGRAAA